MATLQRATTYNIFYFLIFANNLRLTVHRTGCILSTVHFYNELLLFADKKFRSAAGYITKLKTAAQARQGAVQKEYIS